MFIPIWLIISLACFLFFLVYDLIGKYDRRYEKEKANWEVKEKELIGKISRLEKIILPISCEINIPDTLEKYIEQYVRTGKKGGIFW